MRIEAAILSVSDRTGLIELGRDLMDMNVKILSTGGTAGALRGAGISVSEVSHYTGFPEVLDGRVKTLHPRIHAGILARRELPEHRQVLEEQDIMPIGLVVVNLYPFIQTIEKEGVTLEEAIEQIDIGGPALIRSSAKNFRHVTVVVDPSDYSSVVAEMKSAEGGTSESTRWQLARKAFRHTAAYDSAISAHLEGIGVENEGLPPVISINLVGEQGLRYGENPHQRAGLYRVGSPPADSLVSARQHQGKKLSFNNYMDLQAAWSLCCEFRQPFCAIIKHTNPCGAARGEGEAEAYQKALACDPVSAFGSVLGFTCPVDGPTAEKISELFVEAVIAPGYEADAFEIFATKKNLRVMEMSVTTAQTKEFDFKKISGGFLVQESDHAAVQREELKVVTRREPEEGEVEDLLFAWTVCKHVKSNAIVYARQGQTIGIGAGQMSRVDSVRLGAQKAQLSLAGCAMASDAFFPFRDGLDEAARAGVRAVIQPGGSIRDEEAIDAADEHGMAMVFTGIRHFRH